MLSADARGPYAAAAAGAPKAGRVERIEVIERRPEPPPDPSGFATAIEVEPQLEEFKTTGQLLSETAGVQVRRFGGLGDFATISIRGSTAGQVRFFFDGIPLTRARSETINLADLPLEPLRRIEVYRGVAPLSLGGAGLAGVVNLVSRDATSRPRASLLAGGGSFATRRGALFASGTSGDLSASVSLSYLGSEGDFPFEDDNGTPLNPFDDERVDRRNNDFNSGDALLKASYDLSPRTRVTGLSELFVNEQGVPGIGALQSDRARLFELRSLSYLRLRADRVAGSPLEIEPTLYFVYEEERFDDPEGEIGVGNQRTRNRTFTGGAFVHAQRGAGPHLLEGRLDLEGQVFVPRDLLAAEPEGADQRRISFSAGVGDTLALVEDRALLTLQLRYELADDSFGGQIGPGGDLETGSGGSTHHLFTPRLGVRVWLGDDVSWRANVGRYGRIPSFFELFGNRGSVVGNPALDPERGLNLDTGFDLDLGARGPLDRLVAEAAFFYRSIDDLIVLDQNSQRVSIPRNIGSAEVLGAELSLQVRAWERLSLKANYTFQDARDRSDIPSRRDNELAGIPPHEVYLRSELQAGRRWRPFYELAFTSANFTDAANLREVPSRTIHTVGLRTLLFDGALSLTFEARNLTDDQVQDVAGFPLPGRSFFGTVAYRWPSVTRKEHG